MVDRSQVIEEDALEDDWEIVRRNPLAAEFPTTIDMAEAIERICKALVEYVCYLSGRPEATKKEIEAANKFPIFTIIPFYDIKDKKRLYKATVIYEEHSLKFMTDEHDRCEKAVEQLFNMIHTDFNHKSKELSDEADKILRDSNDTRQQARLIRRISSGMGTYDIHQPNLNFDTKSGVNGSG